MIYMGNNLLISSIVMSSFPDITKIELHWVQAGSKSSSLAICIIHVFGFNLKFPVNTFIDLVICLLVYYKGYRGLVSWKGTWGKFQKGLERRSCCPHGIELCCLPNMLMLSSAENSYEYFFLCWNKFTFFDSPYLSLRFSFL